MTPIQVPCKHCRATPGEHCTRPDGTRMVDNPHECRWDAAEDAWLASLGYEPIHGGAA